MDPNEVASLLEQRAWVPLAALVIAFAVRLVKSDTKLPINLEPRYRIWLGVGLGAVSGVLDHVVSGTPWRIALVGGAVSLALAVLGHETVVSSLRGGREIPIPGLMIPGAAPSPGKPITVHPPVEGPPSGPSVLLPLLLVGAFAGAPVLVSGCSLFTAKNAKSVLDAAQLACLFASTLTDAPAVLEACRIDAELTPVVRQLLAQRDGARKAGVVWSADAGAP